VGADQDGHPGVVKANVGGRRAKEGIVWAGISSMLIAEFAEVRRVG